MFASSQSIPLLTYVVSLLATIIVLQAVTTVPIAAVTDIMTEEAIRHTAHIDHLMTRTIAAVVVEATAVAVDTVAMAAAMLVDTVVATTAAAMVAVVDTAAAAVVDTAAMAVDTAATALAVAVIV